MARSTQNDPEWQLAPEEESTVHDQVEIVQAESSPFSRVIPAPETLNIGHAGLRSECWAALRQATPRYRRPARKAHAAALFETIRRGRSALQLGWLRIYIVKSVPRGVASGCCLRLRPPGSGCGHKRLGTARGGDRHSPLPVGVSRPGRGRGPKVNYALGSEVAALRKAGQRDFRRNNRLLRRTAFRAS